jgi:hypothetical protein
VLKAGSYWRSWRKLMTRQTCLTCLVRKSHQVDLQLLALSGQSCRAMSDLPPKADIALACPYVR